MAVTVVELIGVLLGGLLCSLPTLLYGATFPPLAITSLALAAAAAGLALVRPGVHWQTGAGVGLGLTLVVVLRIVADYTRDPTSHNLAPFEVAAALIVGLTPAMLGVVLGNVLRRTVPWPWLGGMVLVAAAVGGTAASAMATASDIVRVEAIAADTVTAIVAAQGRFRAAHPERGFTCDLRELGVSLPGAIVANHPSENYRVGEIVYRGGTAAVVGDYRYSLKCTGDPDPQEQFVLTARAEIVGSRPLDTFCAGPDGDVRTIASGRFYSCLAEGRIVMRVE